jgi:hypothetical protein
MVSDVHVNDGEPDSAVLVPMVNAPVVTLFPFGLTVMVPDDAPVCWSVTAPDADRALVAIV